MKVESIELTLLDLPFTKHTGRHMQYWLPHWRIAQICRLTMSNGVVGFGETIPNYTWAKVPEGTPVIHTDLGSAGFGVARIDFA